MDLMTQVITSELPWSSLQNTDIRLSVWLCITALINCEHFFSQNICTINQSMDGWCVSVWIRTQLGSLRNSDPVRKGTEFLTQAWSSRPHPTFPGMEHGNALSFKTNPCCGFPLLSVCVCVCADGHLNLRHSHRDAGITGSRCSELPLWCCICDARDDGMLNSRVYI